MTGDDNIRLRDAIRRIQSLNLGDLAVPDVIACGPAAIAPLRTILFAREPSGLFEARCRTVQALAALGAFDVLTEFLRSRTARADPVEQFGDDAVINAAARALAAVRSDRVFALMTTLAGKRMLPGIIAALGSFDRVDAIPTLVDALVDDDCRPPAEAALRRLGNAAYSALSEAERTLRSFESPSRIRQYHSVLGLLGRLGAQRKSCEQDSGVSGPGSLYKAKA